MSAIIGLARAGLFTGIGFAVGFLFFRALRWNTDLYLTPGKGAQGFALHVGRIALVTGAWFLIARSGAVGLGAAFVGFMAARQTVTAQARRTS